MIHPDTELKFISSELGYGVIAKEFIPKGTITWVQDKLDREFTEFEVKSMDTIYQDIIDRYAFRNNQGRHVLCWDISRFVNHSFRSNCLSTAYDFEVAIRDIYPGEELTDDYGYLNLNKPFYGRDEQTERKVVYPDDLLKYHRDWDRELLRAFKFISRVHQPLRKLISIDLWQEIVKIERGEQEMKSILSLYFNSKSN